MMAAVSLVGILASSGVPLFVRHIGPGKPPPYALIGSLNGVHVFGEAQGVTLYNTRTLNATITWKTFHECIRLILVKGNECSCERSDNILLDLSFSSLILILGLDAIIKHTNVERLKRDIRSCYPLLDELLTRSSGGGEHNSFSHLVQCAECVIPPDNFNLQNELEKFCDTADSTYGCIILGRGRVLCGTKNYWSLSSIELVLLPILLSTNTFSIARDLPVFLPNKSPDVPFRLLSMRLTSDVSVLVLCGPTPTLTEIIRSSAIFWSSHYQGLEKLASLLPWNMSPALLSALDQSVIGLLLVNYDMKKCVSCVHFSDHDTTSRSFGVSKKVSALRSTYQSIVGGVLLPPAIPPDDLPPQHFHLDHTPIHSYISTDNYKIYIIQSSTYHIFVLFPPSLPIHIARRVTRRTLEIFTKGKHPKL